MGALDIESNSQQVFGYVRYTGDYEQPVLVLLNFSEEPVEMEFQLPEEFSGKLGSRSLVDLLTDERVSIGAGETKQLTVPGMTARVLASM